ncbi:MAG TPA: bis-aminopropyl spermidine synthase family protein [Streptosporangiaceae bacterium]
MTAGLAEFRELMGLMPHARLALLGLLFDGPASLDDLVRVSALPRRDVEDFLAALDGAEFDPGTQRYRLAPGARDHYQDLHDEFRKHRPVLSPADEDRLCQLAERLIQGVPPPRKRYDHVQATPETVVRRVKWLTETFDLSTASVLFAGDHDLTSLLLAQVATDAKVTVADIDEHLLAYIEDCAGQLGWPGRIGCVYADFRFGLPPALAGTADVVFTDPPYTAEGLSLFLSRSLASLRRHSADGRVMIAFGHSRRRPDLGRAAQREILRLDAVIDGMVPHFNSYFGAQAVGSASDLYCCQPAARTSRRIDRQARPEAARGIYTHGEHSVESQPNRAADILRLLPEIIRPGPPHPQRTGLVTAAPGPAREFGSVIGLGTLMDKGVDPSVTRRVDEFVIDLRDDPGPWLMRSLLALNADKVTCVLPRRHEGLAGFEAGAPAWELLRRKYPSMSARELPDAGLVTLQCERAGSRAAEAGDELAAFILQRAHGRLGNVWREGLIGVAQRGGRTLTQREARSLVESHAANSHDLALRLMDVPVHHFGALHRAVEGSLATLMAS